MDYARVTIAEAADCFIAGDLPTGETVRVTTFFDMKSATSPVLTTNTATEIGSTGKYYWCLDEMETSPAAEMIVLWILTAPVSGRTTWGVLHIGGYPGVVQSVVAGAITAAALAADAITADKIADDAIGADQIGAGAIVAATFAAGAIDAAAIKDAAIDAATFAAGAINAAAIAASALDNKGNWSKAGDEMDLLDAPNATAVAAIQAGLATSLEVGAAVTAAEAAETAAEAAEAEATVISTMLETPSLAPNAVVFVRPAP